MIYKISKIADHQTYYKMKNQLVPDPPDEQPNPPDKPPKTKRSKDKKSDKSVKSGLQIKRKHG